MLKIEKYAPKGDTWQQALTDWKQLKSDDGAIFDSVVTLEAKDIKAQVTLGH